MRMVKVSLSDGTSKEMTQDEFNALQMVDGMFKEFNGRLIYNVEFFEEDGR